jgi:aquaporin Z
MIAGNSEGLEEGREPRGELGNLVSEFFGTLVVTLGSIGPAAVASALGMSLGYAVEMSCTGVASAVMIYALRYVSGAHFNPYITISFALRGDFAWHRVWGYVLMQFLGAIAAGALVLAIFHPDRTALLPQMRLGPWPAFWLEIILTAIVIMVAHSTANVARFIGPASALANGLTTVLARWIGGRVSSGSMNPARTLGPAILVGGFGSWWIYVVAPAIGTAVGLAFVAAIWRHTKVPAPER